MNKEKPVSLLLQSYGSIELFDGLRAHKMILKPNVDKESRTASASEQRNDDKRKLRAHELFFTISPSSGRAAEQAAGCAQYSAC